MIVTFYKFPFDTDDETMVARVAKENRVPMNIARAMSGVGLLVACTSCLEKTHIAPWRNGMVERPASCRCKDGGA